MPNWLNKLLGNDTNKSAPQGQPDTQGSPDGATASPFPGLENVRFGRYSDNNKSSAKTQSWYKAEEFYKKKNYSEAILSFFEYLRDEDEDNVHFYPVAEPESSPPAPGGTTDPANTTGNQKFSFDIVQGSRKIYGESDGSMIVARVPLVIMEQPATAVMRRLLELNYSLYYSRSALDEEGRTLYMVFDTKVSNASPNKLYYGFRELAIKADKQDDMLLSDFSYLKPADTNVVRKPTEQELDMKYKYFIKWTEETLKRVDELNQDSFSGAIAYLLLGLIYRIDFLLTPEAKLLSEIERVNNIYWKKKEEVALVERNRMMKNAIKKLLETTKEEFTASIFHSKGTFAISTPPTAEKIREYITNANRDSHWYTENKYPEIALLINEYGMLYNEFIYSMPKVLTDLITIYLAVMHPSYFEELGLTEAFYDTVKETFNKDLIIRAVNTSLSKFGDKYPEMNWNHERISYDSLYEFGISFSEQITNLNLKTKRT